jgi:Fic/DOC family
MLYALPTLDAADQRALSRAAKVRRKLRYELARPRPWYGQFRRAWRAGMIQGSTALAGCQVSLDDAEDAVIGVPPLGTVPPEVYGYRDALRYVDQLVADPKVHYDRGLLSALHFLVLGPRGTPYPLRERRDRAVGPDGYEPPEPYEARILLDELLDWLNDGDRNESALVRAAVAHLNLIRIRPWQEANGRVSRCLHTLVLMESGGLTAEFCGIEEWPATGRGTRDALTAAAGETWSPATSDTHSWVRRCLRAHHQQTQLLHARYTEYATLWTALEDLAARRHLPDRTVAALFAAARGARVRPTTYQHDANLTEPQATRDLQFLTDQNLLLAHPTHYTAAPTLRALAHPITAARPLPTDPYSAEPSRFSSVPPRLI